MKKKIFIIMILTILIVYIYASPTHNESMGNISPITIIPLPMVETHRKSREESNKSRNSYRSLLQPEQELNIISQSPEEELNTVSSNTYTPLTKSVYTKGQDVILPASLTGGPFGYIGRDYVCYRGYANDSNFMASRGGCMACQVDLSNKLS